MENLVINTEFWAGKRVLVTGHTGFKGSWLCLWLQRLGADVSGYALTPAGEKNLFDLTNVADGMESVIGDVRNLDGMKAVFERFRPEIVIHMAAQALVRYSYCHPVETYSTNVMGTVHMLEVARQVGGVKAILNVTSDKCYENQEWSKPYQENEPMGGADPYSSSKGCAELVTVAYRSSYFPESRYAEHGTALASARAGNVIGGGDWSEDRLIPDIMRAIDASEPVNIRSPDAVRPWQFVLEPLAGYLCVIERLYAGELSFAEAWNFGPDEEDARPVSWIVNEVGKAWEEVRLTLDAGEHPHEASLLKLDCSKAKLILGWKPRLNLGTAIHWVVEWYKDYERSGARKLCLAQIEKYQNIEKT